MEKRNVPKLRFKGFEDDWKITQLSELLFESKLKNKSLEFGKEDVLSVSGEYGIVNQIEYLGRSYAGVSVKNYGVVKNTDIVYTKSPLKNNPYGIIKTNKGKDGIVSTLYAVYSCKYNIYNVFLDYYFQLDDNTNKYVRPLVQKGAKNDMKINNEYFLTGKISIPYIEEQTKIANFLSKVDKIIEEQDLKVKDLELYKKGIMQKIFKQEIRFKNDNGENYPKWEEKKLGELGYTYTGLSGKTKENFGFGNGKYVTYMNVFKNIKIDTNMIDLVDISEDEKQNNVFKGDLLFTTSSETPEEVGMVSVCDKDIQGLYLNSFCFGFRLNELNNINFYFMAYYLRSSEIRLKISILAQGSTRYNLSKTELMKLKLKIPSLEEQTKIANFLSNIDKIIEEENKKLEDLRLWKHGLLQQMFV